MGGALYVTQDTPTYWIDTVGSNGNAKGQMVLSQALPAYTFWVGIPPISNVFWYVSDYSREMQLETLTSSIITDCITPFQVSGSARQVGQTMTARQVIMLQRQPDAFPTYDDPTEPERCNPILRDQRSRKDKGREGTLARLCEAQEEPEKELVTGDKQQSLHQGPGERCEGSDTKRFRAPVRQLSLKGGSPAGAAWVIGCPTKKNYQQCPHPPDDQARIPYV